MSRIANDTDVGRDPLAAEGDSLELVAAGQGEMRDFAPNANIPDFTRPWYRNEIGPQKRLCIEELPMVWQF
jgi:hypothetical protein